jgi:hypothetical protein
VDHRRPDRRPGRRRPGRLSFGQPAGPPATARQLRDLTALVESAGHDGFRDARGPLGLTQRQAGGRFTRDEAEALIARLEGEAPASGPDAGGPHPPSGPPDPPAAPTGPAPDGPATGTRRQRLARQLERVPEDLLVDEVRRRGWSVSPPD